MRHAIRNLALRNLLIALAMLVTASAALVRTYTWARRYEDARSQFERTDEVAPNFPVLQLPAATCS